MGHRVHFAGINTRPLAQAAKGQDVLVSYADIQKSPGTWKWLRPLLERGHFRSVILDSGAFTELKEKIKLAKALEAGKLTWAEYEAKVARVFKVDLVAFADFCVEHQDLFEWVANLDDIQGDVGRSNANLRYLESRGVRVVPVFHEGEDIQQLRFCIEHARRGTGRLAIGCQRPKGSLIPKNVVAFLRELWPFLEAEAKDIRIHGFGLTRYASSACPGHEEGFPFHTSDSTTWIAEGCAVERSGALGKGIEARHKAFRATVASYSAVRFAAGPAGCGILSVTGFRHHVANEAGGQARTVANRLRGHFAGGLDWGSA